MVHAFAAFSGIIEVKNDKLFSRCGYQIQAQLVMSVTGTFNCCWHSHCNRRID